MKFRWVLAALIFGLMARGVEDVLPAMGMKSTANITNLSQIIQYVVMFIGGWIVVRRGNYNLGELFGKLKRRRDLLLGTVAAILLLGFTFGMNTWIVWIVAQWNPSFAYRFWDFHHEPYSLMMPFTAYLIFAMKDFVVGPVAEEFMFRGLMFKSLNRYGSLFAVTLIGVIFVVLHLPQPLWISTFAFSFILSLLYVRYQSLWPGICAHALFNVLAFVLQYYVGAHYQRPETYLADLRYWIPELVMLCASVPALAALAVHCWPARKDWDHAGSVYRVTAN